MAELFHRWNLAFMKMVYMEEACILDVEKQKDIFALHYVFLPRINDMLEKFVQGYSHTLYLARRDGQPSSYGS